MKHQGCMYFLRAEGALIQGENAVVPLPFQTQTIQACRHLKPLRKLLIVMNIHVQKPNRAIRLNLTFHKHYSVFPRWSSSPRKGLHGTLSLLSFPSSPGKWFTSSPDCGHAQWACDLRPVMFWTCLTDLMYGLHNQWTQQLQIKNLFWS